jgi:septum formation protein
LSFRAKQTFSLSKSNQIILTIRVFCLFSRAGIQGPAGAFVSSITGCYFNVMGFPAHKFASKLLTMIEEGEVKL